MEGVELRVILDAIRTAPDNEFVTVKQRGQNIRAAKSNGSLVVHVTEAAQGGRNVDITVPMKVVDALFSTAIKDELDVSAAIRALAEARGTLLVSVQDAKEHVRIWVDSRSSQP
jgi:ketol-acid reductoisomerase